MICGNHHLALVHTAQHESRSDFQLDFSLQLPGDQVWLQSDFTEKHSYVTLMIRVYSVFYRMTKHASDNRDWGVINNQAAFTSAWFWMHINRTEIVSLLHVLEMHCDRASRLYCKNGKASTMHVSKTCGKACVFLQVVEHSEMFRRQWMVSQVHRVLSHIFKIHSKACVFLRVACV